MNISQRVLNSIKELAEKYNLDKVILFGSRARGDNRERSDIDIAISGGNTVRFISSVDDIETLLSFDVVDMDSSVSKELMDNIGRDGVLIYEKVG